MTVLPPAGLMQRVSGNDDPDVFLRTGRRLAATMMRAAIEHAERPVWDVLDWGCGCGRVMRHISADWPQARVRGCDIDPSAVTWCQLNLSGEFAVSPLYPPLPYEDEAFDAVLALSVMTHLARRLQRLWLRDLARVLRPGGLVVASVHGRAAAAGFGVTGLSRGIRDHYLNTDLAGVVPEGYYRDVIQSEVYTRAAWSDHLDVVAYEETGLEQHDLVICRKAGAA